MKWRPHFKFAMPGVIVLFLAAVLQNFIPQPYRPYVFASIILTLLLGLITGQFRRLGDQQKKNPKPQTAKILGSISVLIGLVGVALPLSAAFLETVEQCVAAALRIPAHISESTFPGDLLTYSVLFLPLNIIALIIGILARRSMLGKAGIIIAGVGICLPIGCGLGILMLLFLSWLSPPILPYYMPY